MSIGGPLTAIIVGVKINNNCSQTGPLDYLIPIGGYKFLNRPKLIYTDFRLLFL